MNNEKQIIIDGVDVLKEKINMCFILLLNKLETPETIEQTIYDHLETFVKEWNTQLTSKIQELDFLKSNEDLLITKLQLLWGKQIAEEQGDCKNIDYSKPRTKEIYHKITEIERTLKDVAFAQSVQMKKTQPLGETGSPRSYRNWERKERNLLERRLKDDSR